MLDKLACPACKSRLELDDSKSRLICRKCSLGYRIESGIPVLLENEAEKIK